MYIIRTSDTPELVTAPPNTNPGYAHETWADGLQTPVTGDC